MGGAPQILPSQRPGGPGRPLVFLVVLLPSLPSFSFFAVGPGGLWAMCLGLWCPVSLWQGHESSTRPVLGPGPVLEWGEGTCCVRGTSALGFLPAPDMWEALASRQPSHMGPQPGIAWDWGWGRLGSLLLLSCLGLQRVSSLSFLSGCWCLVYSSIGVQLVMVW